MTNALRGVVVEEHNVHQIMVSQVHGGGCGCVTELVIFLSPEDVHASQQQQQCGNVVPGGYASLLEGRMYSKDVR